METATNSHDWHAPLALLLLRLGLGYFLIVWGINKFLAPGQTVAIWGYFYGVEIDKLLSVLMAFAAIFLLREQDLWSLDVWRARRASSKLQ